jgi:U3 small nucleolar RNA-associated protein 22
VVGSFALKTSIRTEEPIQIDMVVAMPKSIFQEKDYLNFRYFCKRAYYLACLAAGLKSSLKRSYDISFCSLDGITHSPVIAVSSDIGTKSLTVRIIPELPQGVFLVERLSPSKNCVRSILSEGEKEPTAFYNGSIMSDSLMTSYMKLQHDSLRDFEAYREANMLGRIWLRQRGLQGRRESGGFGNFEFAVIMSLLLQGGGPKNAPSFSPGYSSYQLFKATLQYLATRDLISNPHVVNGVTVQNLKGTEFPVFFDGQRHHNVLYKMTPWSYRHLQSEARITNKALSDTAFDQFDSTFIMRADNKLCRYDVMIEISNNQRLEKIYQPRLNMSSGYRALYQTLAKALSNRVTRIHLHEPEAVPWQVGVALPASNEGKLVIGFEFDPHNIDRAIENGPLVSMKTEAEEFRKFWDSKAELRRFKDGTISESVVWDVSPESPSVFYQIVSFSLRQHFGPELEQSVRYEESTTKFCLLDVPRGQSDVAAFQPVMLALQDLERDIRAIEDLPLHLRLIQASDPKLSYTSSTIPFRKGGTKIPANVIVQFEGSARWPDDLRAIHRTKAAMLLKLAESLEVSQPKITCRVGLENEEDELLNQAFLDVQYDSGICFRLRIHHDREATLLERLLSDKSTSPPARAQAAAALAAYKRDYLRRPAHTQAMQALSIRFPSFPRTARLAKRWFSATLLRSHFSGEAVELLAARVYTNPHPWGPPSSARAGLLRLLALLARWDWRAEPWVADVGAEAPMGEDAAAAVATRFRAWRKLDPALNRVVLFVASSVDPDGDTWTGRARPAKVIAARMTELARAAVRWMGGAEVGFALEPLFAVDLSDYDFVVHVNEDFARGARRRGDDEARFKNLQLQKHEVAAAGPDVLALFVEEITSLYAGALLLFTGEERRDFIAGLWVPHERRAWKLKLGYSSRPTGEQSEGCGSEPTVEVNRDAILSEIARLGGDLVRSIEVRR